MKYFSIKELTSSATAVRKGIDNTPTPTIRAALTALVSNVLDPLRELYGKPIIVTSVYRCPKLNKAVGGATNSQHTKGEAADIRSVSDKYSDNKKLFELIKKSSLPFDQLIWEYGTDTGPDWIHVSFKAAGRRNILRAYKKAGKAYYVTIK